MSKKTDTADRKIITEAKKRFEMAASAESTGRVDRLDDIKFVRLGEQWPDAVARDRKRPGSERPMLTINRLFQFRNQVINEIRQNEPSIKVRPVDDYADPDTAEIFMGIIRHIQDASNASIAYDTAAEWQVDTGLGYFRIITDYCDPESFDQDIRIKRVPDPNKVYFDTNSTEPDGSDAQFAFVVEEMPREEFEELYPSVDVTSWDLGKDSGGWHSDDTVRVAEYFAIEAKTMELALLQDGSIVWADEVTDAALIVKTRKSQRKKCNWHKIAGDTLLDSTEIPTSYIPVIPVYGSEVWIEGERHLHGLTRHAKDPARLYNYMQSANVELLALAPRAPYIAAAGQLDGHEAEWENANRINVSVLTYNPISDNGTQVPPPRREMPPGTNPGLESAMNRSVDDIKAVMGIYDASVGNKESNQSGKAILSQQRQASIGNFHFSDNLGRSIQHAGRILVEMIPKIYDTARVARIFGVDGTPQTVRLDPDMEAPKTEVKDEKGEIQSIYNLGVGKYDVVVDTGPSYATKRQEAAEAMMAMVQTDPQIMQVAGDLIVANMDWPGAEEISKRMKLMLPPQLQQQEKEGEGRQIDPKIEQQMNQMADQVEHLSQELLTATAALESKKDELEIKWFEAETKRMQVEADAQDKQFKHIHEMTKAERDYNDAGDVSEQTATINQD